MKIIHAFTLCLCTVFFSCQKTTESKKTEPVIDSVLAQSNNNISSNSLTSDNYELNQTTQSEEVNDTIPSDNTIRNQEFFRETRDLRSLFNDIEGSTYIRSELNENHPYVNMMRQLDQRSHQKLQALIGVTFKDLIDLALLYDKYDGRTTAETEVIRKKISNALSPSTEELERYQSLIEGPKFEADSLSENLSNELTKLIAYHQSVNTLYNYSELRKNLGPLMWDLCPQYYALRKKINEQNKKRNDSTLNNLYSDQPEVSVNQSFLNALLAFKQEGSKNSLTIENPIAPIFNYREDTVGIYGTEYDRSSSDSRLLEQTTYKEDAKNIIVPNGELYLYDSINDKAFQDNSLTYVFSTTKAIPAQIEAFGVSEKECDNGYSFYLTDIKKSQLTNQSIMFASPFNLDLTYKSYPSIDSLINAQYPGICVDCPSSFDQQVTFAKLNGFDNLYFTYAYDPGKALDDVDTPLRGLYYVKNDIVINIWIDSHDAFGCSCL